jgi:choloylglycine hydrolase
MIADKNRAITVEAVKDGVKVFENPVHVLTNNPGFDMQMFSLNNYMSCSAKPPLNSFSTHLNLETYSRGMGGLGLPGDLSSQSRFIKAAFTRANSVSKTSESESISQFFHILGSAAQQRGCVDLGNNKYEYTIYTSCCNTDKGIFYYTTYENSQVSAVDMRKENLDSDKLVSYPMIKDQQIKMQN